MTENAVLAIETATEQVGVALAAGGRVLVREARGLRAPSRSVYTWIQELLAEGGVAAGEVGAVAFGAGPGSFTGVRVATAVAQSLGYAGGIPVIPVSTLAALARPTLVAGEAEAVVAALDARMGEIYVGSYARGAAGLLRAIRPDALAGPESILEFPGASWVAVGPGFKIFPELLRPAGPRLLRQDTARLPDVRDVLALGLAGLAAGEGLAAEAAVPNYVRSRVTR